MALSIIALPESMSHADNEMFAVISTNLAPLTPNLRIRLVVRIETVYQVGTNVDITLPAQKPDSNGDVRFALNDILKDALKFEYDIPAVGGTVPAKCHHLIRRFVLLAYEISGASQAVTDTLSGGAMNGWFHAFKGGIPNERFAINSYFNAGGWWEQPVPKLPFIEWPAGDILTHIAQDQWAYLFYGYAYPGMAGNQDFYLNVNMTWDDGTTTSFNTAITVIQGAQVWMMPMGYLQLDIPAQEVLSGKLCVAYLVRVAYLDPSPMMYGPTRRYIVDRNQYAYSRQLQYIDGLGVFRQLLLRGAANSVVSVEKKTVAAYTQSNYASYLTESIAHDIEVRNGVRQTSGTITNEETKYYLELLASPLVMVMDAQLGWVKVVVENSTMSQNPNENTKSIVLEYAPAWSNVVVDMISQ